MSDTHIVFGYAIRHPAVEHPFICACEVQQPLKRYEDVVHDTVAVALMPRWRLLAFNLRARSQSFCRVTGPQVSVAVDFFRLREDSVPFMWHLPMEDLSAHFARLERGYAADGRVMAIDFASFRQTLRSAERCLKGQSPFSFVGQSVRRLSGHREEFTVRSVIAFIDCVRFVLEYAPGCSLLLTLIPHAGEGMRHVWREENADGTYTDTEIGFQW